MKTHGFAIHLHHDILVEYCYDYDDRVRVIKNKKLTNEQEIRLRLFKMLSKEALKDVPKKCQEPYQKCQEPYQKRHEEYQKWKRYEEYKKWREAYKKWPRKSKDAFHKKWCGCSEWNGKEIVFN